jgi:putative NADH-flavin reductase
MDRLMKNMNCIKDLDSDADMLEILGILRKWNKLKKNEELESIITAMIRVVGYVGSLRLDRDSVQHIIDELSVEKNHYQLRAREAEKELKMLRDKQDPLKKFEK